MPSKKKKYNSRFPPARIKKIMQTDEEIGKVAAAVPVLISKCVEMFLVSILENTGSVTNARKAKTMTTSHLKECIMKEKTYDFMRHLVVNEPDCEPNIEECTTSTVVHNKEKVPRKRAASSSKPQTKRAKTATECRRNTTTDDKISEVLSPPDKKSEVLSPPDKTSEVLSPPDKKSEVLSPPDKTSEVFSPCLPSSSGSSHHHLISSTYKSTEPPSYAEASKNMKFNFPEPAAPLSRRYLPPPTGHHHSSDDELHVIETTTSQHPAAIDLTTVKRSPTDPVLSSATMMTSSSQMLLTTPPNHRKQQMIDDDEDDDYDV